MLRTDTHLMLGHLYFGRFEEHKLSVFFLD